MNVTVVGAAGVVGGELLRLLVDHPDVGEASIRAESTSATGKHVSEVHHDLVMHSNWMFQTSLEHYTTETSEVVFLCLGHGNSATWMADHNVDDNVLVIDLSTDYRSNPDWTYGLCEWNRPAIVNSTRIANPGCFATAIELALLPLSQQGMLSENVVINALTGSTGAGQQPTDTTHYSWRSNNVSVYKAFTHQHLTEIQQVIGMKPTMIPMRGPFTRGIFATCIVDVESDLKSIENIYERFYSDAAFVHVTAELPDVKRVCNTNLCCIGLTEHDGKLLVVSVIDNLLKGAAGQAVQNMNLAKGYDESRGLRLKGVAF